MKLFEFWLAQTFWIQQASTIAQLLLSECSSAYHYLRMHCSMESLEVSAKGDFNYKEQGSEVITDR